MLSNVVQNEKKDIHDQSLIVNRVPIRFDGRDCRLLTFTNLTSYKKLKEQEEMAQRIETMNASIHHEMLTPLAINVEVADRLKEQVQGDDLKDMAEVIVVNSKIVMFHANDLLDSKIMQNGKFEPSQTYQYVG